MSSSPKPCAASPTGVHAAAALNFPKLQPVPMKENSCNQERLPHVYYFLVVSTHWVCPQEPERGAAQSNATQPPRNTAVPIWLPLHPTASRQPREAPQGRGHFPAVRVQGKQAVYSLLHQSTLQSAEKRAPGYSCTAFHRGHLLHSSPCPGKLSCPTQKGRITSKQQTPCSLASSAPSRVCAASIAIAQPKCWW